MRDLVPPLWAPRALTVALATCAVLLGSAGCAAGSSRTKSGLLEPFSAAGITAPTGVPRRFALVIGVDAFEDPRLPALRFAESDARAMGEALTDYDGVTVLTSPSRAHILEALRALERQVTRPEDTVLVYVSTHGSLGRRPGRELERFLMAHDTRLDLVDSTGIAVADLLGALDRLVSRRRAVILAMCHSGSGKSALDDPLARALAGRKSAPPPLEEVSEAMIVVSAAAFGEEARESDALGHDVYTYYLLEAMRGGDRDGDGAVTLGEAHDWARERTYAFSNGLQRPSAESDVLGVDPVVLSGRRSRLGRPVLFSYAPSAEGIELRVDGRTKASLPGGLAVDPGPRTIELRARATGETLYEGELDLAEGERADLAALLPGPWQVRVAARAGVVAPLDGALLPVLFAGGVDVDVIPGPLGPLGFGVSARYLRSQGPEGALDVTVEGVDLGAHASLGLVEADPLVLGARLGAGLWLLRRERRGPTFVGEESLRAPRVSAGLEAGLRLLEPLEVTVGVEAGVLWARLGGEVGTRGLLAATLGIRWRQ